MNVKEVKKWITIADYDLKGANDGIIAKNPATNIVCFCSQQCVEKYLKAYLVYQNKEFRKTHNIAEILKLCVECDAEFNGLEKLSIQKLTAYATDLRYPKHFYLPTVEEAKESIEIAQKVKDFVLEKLKGKGFEL